MEYATEAIHDLAQPYFSEKDIANFYASAHILITNPVTVFYQITQKSGEAVLALAALLHRSLAFISLGQDGVSASVINLSKISEIHFPERSREAELQVATDAGHYFSFQAATKESRADLSDFAGNLQRHYSTR